MSRVTPDTAPQLTTIIRRLSSFMAPIPTGIAPYIPNARLPEAVIFDIYGTLFLSAAGDIGKDSAVYSAGAFRQALADAGIQIDSGDERLFMAAGIFRDEIMKRHKKLQSLGVDVPEVDICEIWKNVLERLCIKEDSRPVADERITIIAISYECRTNPVWPVPGVVSLLDFFKERGVRTGIISNAQFYTPLMFEALLGKSVKECGFDKDLCAWSWKTGEAKPSLTMFRQIDHILRDRDGMPAGSILYVGNDMLKDILPAHALNWKTALFAGDKRSLRLRKDDIRVKRIEPWCIITELEQLKIFDA